MCGRITRTGQTLQRETFCASVKCSRYHHRRCGQRQSRNACDQRAVSVSRNLLETISLRLSGVPRLYARATPLGCCGLGRASSPTTPASPPRRKSACHGGAKRLRFGRHREVAPRKGHNFRTTAVLRGFRDQTCPSLENRTEGEDAGIGPAELPRQQER